MLDSYPLQNGRESLALDDATIISRMTRSIVGAARHGITGLRSAIHEMLGSHEIGDNFLMRIVNDSKQMLEFFTHCEYTPYEGDLIFIRATIDILRAQEQRPSLWAPLIQGKIIEYEVEAPHECLLQRQHIEQFGRQFTDELLRRQSVTSGLPPEETAPVFA
jgi:enterobactin synthetase component F